MKKSKIAIRNSSISFISQITSMFFQFMTRSLFLKYLGVELLGISSTFTSLLSTLSLAELGFQTAIVFSLYKPLHERNEIEINKLMNIYKLVYRAIGYFLILASLICLPVIKYILTDVEFTKNIYTIFILQATGVSCSYFLAYKRALLYADQKDYLSKIIDLLFNIILNIVKIMVIIYLQNYLVFLSIQIIQTVLSNFFIHVICGKLYPFLQRDKIDKELLKKIWSNVKNVFAGKIAGYIYASTDNLVISILIGTTPVGYLVNYTTVTNNLKMLSSSMLNPIAPIIGNMLVENKESDSKEKILRIYTHIRFIIAAVIIIPTLVLINKFISSFFGPQYILENSIAILLCIELYIHLVHTACYDYIYGAGLFKQDKYISSIGAFINIVLSIIMAKVIGIEGVLIGTVLSQVFFWISRSILVYRKCFFLGIREYGKYWTERTYEIMIFIISLLISQYMISFVHVDLFIVEFVIGGIICEVIFASIYSVAFWGSEQKKILSDAIGKLGKSFFYRHKNKIIDVNNKDLLE